jgi:hypothetical protein
MACATFRKTRSAPSGPDSSCATTLEPLQATFGRIHVRSVPLARSQCFGNQHKLNCASNEKNYGSHIWDYPTVEGHYGATACIVMPWLVDYVERGGHWTAMAWWIHDHLPYSSLYFSPDWLPSTSTGRGTRAPGGQLRRTQRLPDCTRHPGQTWAERAELPRFPELLGKVMPFTPTKSPAASLCACGRAGKQHRQYSQALARNVGSACCRQHPTRSSAAGEKVYYRAVHTITKWRKAANHSTLESAIRGPNGAATICGKVRIDYAKAWGRCSHWWQEGSSTGSHSCRSRATDGIRVVSIPVGKLKEFDELDGVSERELASYFSRT